jgi:chemotaxis protein methyltransferase CheR
MSTPLSPLEFDVFARFLKLRSGIIITPDKTYLLESRLQPIARKWNLEDLRGIAKKLSGMPDQRLLDDVVDAMTTNETLFFRDQNPFDSLKNYVLPTLTDKGHRPRKIRIWSAACSRGKAAYSIAMLLLEEKEKYAGCTFEIIGTDISREILAKAQSGIFSQFEVQRGLPIQYLVKYFVKDGDRWALKDSVKSMVSFRFFNLLEDPRLLGTFDIVFCRNVLIYFDHDTKKGILERISRALSPDGVLCLGGSESVLDITDKFTNVTGQRSMYQQSAPK